jgi:hypothetical protein
MLVIAGCAVAAVLISVACIPFWSHRPPLSPIKITTVFSGFTNATTGIRLARFRVSNQGGVTVYRWPTYSIEEYGRVSPSYLASLRRGDSLAPAQSRIYVIPAPTNAAPWRVVFNFSRETWRRKLAGLPPAFRWVVPSSALALPVDEAISDWVGLEASSPPAAGERQRLATIIMRPPPMFQPQTNPNPNTNPPKK